MKNYEEYLKPLIKPFYQGSSLCKDSKEYHEVKYYAINENDACAIVKVWGRKSEDKVELPDTVLDMPDRVWQGRWAGIAKTYTVRMVYVSAFDVDYSAPITIPNTVWSIYVNKDINFRNVIPFTFADNPYFSVIEEDKNWAVFSKEEGLDDVHEELICGRLKNSSGFLNGVKIIHNLTAYDDFNIPDSVEKIYKLSGSFSSVTFEGKLPEFGKDALADAVIGHIEVCTPKLENPRKSVEAIVNVKQTENETFYRRAEEDTLFAAAPHVLEFPKAKGYIALTRADFEHDGELLLINTPWIATICPKRLMRSDGEVNGSTILIGLREDKYNHERGGGIFYDVYEDPMAVDAMIAPVQP